MKRFIWILPLLFVFGCSRKPLETVQRVDLNRYAGTWYEIARLPTRFQKGCACTNAEYTALDERKIRVVNRCVKKGKWDEARGKAFVRDKETNAKLAVQFQWPFRGKYWILDLADDYSHALVGHPNRNYLWILSRTKTMDETQINQLVAKAKDMGFPTGQLLMTNQACGD